MAEILVSGYYGFHNTGDEAILAGIIRSIRELDPAATFTVISGTAAYTRSLGVEAVSRDDYKGIWRAIGRADMVLQGGGSLLQDVTSLKSLLYYLGIITMARLQRKPVMVYAQGIGPVTTLTGRALFPAILNGVNLITVRDKESAATLRKLGVTRPPAMVTADPALALGPANRQDGAGLLARAGVDLDRPVIGVSVRPWKTAEQRFQLELARALDQLIEETGAQAVFIPMQQPQDAEAAAAIGRLMTRPSIRVQGAFTPTEIQAMLGTCDLLIAMRFHALVFAAMNGVPLLGLSYDPKINAFLDRVGEPVAGSTTDLTAEALLTAARQIIAHAPEVSQRLLAKIDELTPLARHNAWLALSLLK